MHAMELAPPQWCRWDMTGACVSWSEHGSGHPTALGAWASAGLSFNASASHNGLELAPHPDVVNPGFEINRSFSREPVSAIKRLNISLGAELNLRMASRTRFFHQALKNLSADAGASERSQNRHATDMAIG